MIEINYQKKKDLLDLAKRASLMAYAPYSNFPVGAALISKTGKFFTGCNVENASYGLSLCAERNALASMINSGEKTFYAIAIFSQKSSNCYPCGACRQWLYEFAPDAMVITEDLNGEIVTSSVKSLIPFAFGPENLD